MITSVRQIPRNIPKSLVARPRAAPEPPTPVTPTAGLASVTSPTPGTPINALDVNLAGGYIFNPVNAQGPLYVDPTGPASTTANGTTLALEAGQTFYAIPYSTLPVSVASTLSSQSFVCVQWEPS